MISIANRHVGLERPTKSAPNDFVSFVCPLSKILQKSLPPFSKQQTHKNQEVKALKDITRLLTLVTE